MNFGFLRGLLALAGVMVLTASPVQAQQQYINVLTGGTSGVYYPLGVALSQIYGKAIPAAKATVQATKASAENLNLLQAGRGEIGFTLGDALSDAWKGDEEAGFKVPLKKLRGVAAIYPNYIQIVASADSGIKTIADLKGKRISLDEPGSGTLVNAKALLGAYGVTEKDIKPEYLKQQQSSDKFKDGTLDAFFQTTGYPQGTLTELASTNGFELLAIDGAEAEKLRAQFKFFAADEIPEGTYKGVAGVKTLSVGAQWVTSAKADADVVYQVTKGLWSDKARATLDGGHAKGKAIQKATALLGLGVPLHPGAEKYYREAGLIK